MTTAIDTLSALEKLTKAGFKKAQSKAIIEALTPSLDHAITRYELKAEINKLKAELIVWMVGVNIASISLLIALLN